MATRKLSKKTAEQVAALLTPAPGTPTPAPDFSTEAPAALPTEGVLDHVGNLVARVRQLARDHALAEQNLQAIAADIERLLLITIPDAMDAAGLKDVTLKDGSKLAVVPDLKCGINKANETAAFAFLREKGHGAVIASQLLVDMRTLEDPDAAAEIITLLDEHELTHETKESIHWATLKSLVKDMLEKGEELPASFSVHQFKKAVVKEPKK